MPHRLKLVALALLTLAAALPVAAASLTAEAALDALVARLYAEFTPEQLANISETDILARLRPEEREALATRHQHFVVNVPVTVSLLRDTAQQTPPFWLADSGFAKTDLTVTNTEGWVYEVWQKDFPAGEVGLGINSFENHRPHYFVCVAPQQRGDELEISDRFPSEFSIEWMREGAFVYHDWDSLLLKDVPSELMGQLLLTTIRGRARAAHLVGGFRETPYPSSTAPDQVMLSWTEDPTTTQTVHWRGSTAVNAGMLRYRVADSGAPFSELPAERSEVNDRFLANDPKCHRFTATLTGLQPDTTYAYQAGHPEHDAWSSVATFRTAPAKERPFTFVTFGDTQSVEPWGPVLEAAWQRHRDAAFMLIAGDLVQTGQYRDYWDRFFQVARDAGRSWPLMPCLGNHDVIDGLGAEQWRGAFALPQNGPAGLEPERVYSFNYSNALFVVLDSGLPVIEQAEWLERTLAASDAKWKIVMFHFPPYSIDEGYPDIANLWGYLFDKYSVDIALEGHVHYYMRSHPIYRNRPQPGGHGTTHIVSIAMDTREYSLPPAPYAAVQFTGVPLYQTFDVSGDKLHYRSWDVEGTVRDEFVLEK